MYEKLKPYPITRWQQRLNLYTPKESYTNIKCHSTILPLPSGQIKRIVMDGNMISLKAEV